MIAPKSGNVESPLLIPLVHRLRRRNINSYHQRGRVDGLLLCIRGHYFCCQGPTAWLPSRELGKRKPKYYHCLLHAFFSISDHSQTYLQDDLLLILRRQLISKSIKLKTFGLIGAVVILEVLCRRPTRNLSKTSGPLNSTPFSQVVNIEVVNLVIF